MEWMHDREPFDLRATGTSFALAIALTIALAVFVVLVLAGAYNWAAAVAGL